MSYPPSPYAPLGAPAPPLRPTPVIKPAGAWYLVAVGLAVLGVVLASYAVQQGWRDAERAGLDATATALGSDQPLTIPEPVSATVAYSGLDLTYEEADRLDLIEQLDVRIVEAGSGQEVPLGEYEGYRPLKDTQDGRAVEYLPLYTVRFDQPGDYVISTRAVPGVNLDDSAIVVMESPYRKLRDGVRRAAAFGVGGIAAFVLLTVILARTRGRAKRAWAAANPPVPWQPPGWGAQPAGAWGGPQPPPSWGPGPPGPGWG